jgi:hypothetical protein
MDDAALAERGDALAHDLLAPLVLGGPVHPVRHFGGPLALRLGLLAAARPFTDGDLATRLDVARVRRARLLTPTDALPELDAGDWACLAALNDLLQLTNHHLGGPLTRGRYAKVLANLTWLCARIPPPPDVLSALSRHATFGRALELGRTDSAVSWWTGSARFRGETPPARLIAWPDVRRVHVDARRVPLADMPAGVTGITPADFTDALALWLTRSPLTDLATATRHSPAFAWSATTLSLVATGAGRLLAFRALAGEPPDAVTTVLARAALQVPAAYEEARRLADGFHALVIRSFTELDGEHAAPGHARDRTPRPT